MGAICFSFGRKKVRRLFEHELLRKTALALTVSITCVVSSAFGLPMKVPSFQVSASSIQLEARQRVPMDGQIIVGSQTQSGTVTDELAKVINADVANLTLIKTERELIGLPVAIAAHSRSSTSPLSTLTTQPGIQTDASSEQFECPDLRRLPLSNRDKDL